MAEEKISASREIEEGLHPADDKAAPEAIVKHSYDADEAMKAFEGLDGQELVLDEQTNRRLLRKIDQNIMPVKVPQMSPCLCLIEQILCVVYGLNYLDSMLLPLMGSRNIVDEFQRLHCPTPVSWVSRKISI